MSEKKMPEKKVKVGRISVSVWRNKRLMPGDKDSAGYVEKWVESERVCVQHSSYSRQKNEWNNQQIWMNIEELRDLSQALDEIGEEQSSPSSQGGSMRVHSIMEYVKANSLDAGLDVLDVEEKGVSEILSEYGIYTELTAAEERMVREELRELVEQKEFSESAYMAQCDPFLDLIPERVVVRRSLKAGAKFSSREDFLKWLSRFDCQKSLLSNLPVRA